MNCLGESGPGCSAHAEGCDGSTGIQWNSCVLFRPFLLLEFSLSTYLAQIINEKKKTNKQNNQAISHKNAHTHTQPTIYNIEMFLEI